MNEQTARALNNAAQINGWIFLNYALILALTLMNFLAASVAAIHSAKRRETAWTLVIIFFPFIGWAAYWLNCRPSLDSGYGPLGAPPPEQTPRDVANQVAAALTADVKHRQAARRRC
jgi:hypothetical protein